MAKVLLEKVSKFFPGPKKSKVTAVTNLDLEINDGEFMVLVGPSGCGKTTTLRMIAGLEEIDEGSIFMDGTRVNDLEPKDRDVAMVFQNYALYPHMDVLENISLGLKLRKYPKAEIKERVEEASLMLGIQDLLNRMPDQLSGGQRQRVAVGRALVRRPKVFLFDEPLSNLDARMRLQMRMELTELHQQLGSTMIYVTHDQAEAMTMGDRIVVMNEGSLQQVAPPLTIYQQPVNQFVASFIGSPPMNLLKPPLNQLPEKLASTETDPVVFVKLHSTSNYTEAASQVIGFRPEHGQVLEGNASEKNDENILQLYGTVQWLESTGADTFLHILAGTHKVIVRASSASQWKVDQRVTIQVPVDKLHLF
jgi:multiple sugar transport system ATP-binding protein